MKTRFALQLNDYCTRACGHCVIAASPKGGFAELSDLEGTIAQVGRIVRSRPDEFHNDVTLTGGEILFYGRRTPKIGHVIAMLGNEGMQARIVTRGFTTAERDGNAITYRNFQDLKKKLESGGISDISVSCDIYALGNRGDSLEAVRMLRNAFASSVFSGRIPSIEVVISREGAARTYELLGRLMDSVEFSLSPEWGYLRGMSSQAVGQEIINRFIASDEPPRIRFQHKYGMISEAFFYQIVLNGRARLLGESVFEPYYTCHLAEGNPSSIIIRRDQGIVACGRCNYMEMPEIGNLRGESLASVMERIVPYSGAVNRMRNDHMQELISTGKDICTICPTELPRYLAQVGF